LRGADTFYVGTLKGVGRVYQQTCIDTYSKVAFAKLYDRKTPITAADLLNDRVVPFFDEHEVKLSRVLTTAVQRCRVGWTESAVQQLQGEAKRLIGEGFPNRRMSDSWGGNRLGGCRDCICAADGLAGRRS
jgi:hypothetical protein